MTRNPEKLENWERIESVIKMAQMSTNAFARHIGLPRGENLYQIKRGNNGISVDLANRICDKFPQVSKLWLLTGDGDMLAPNAEPLPAISPLAPQEAWVTFAASALCGLLANGHTGNVVQFVAKHADDMMAQLLDKKRENRGA